MALKEATPSSLLLISIFQLWALISLCSGEECQATTLLEGKYLKNHVISSFVKDDVEGCVDLCLRHAHCYSINFHMVDHKCELNNKTRLSNPEDLVRAANSKYLDNAVRPLKKCSDSLCPGAQVCRVEGATYSCKGESHEEAALWSDRDVCVCVCVCVCARERERERGGERERQKQISLQHL